MKLTDRVIRFLPIILGMAVHLAIFFYAGDDFSIFSIAFLLWSWLPYTLCLACAFVFRSPWPSFLAAALILTNDLITVNAVFFHPKSSTAAIGLLFTPLINIGVASVALLVGWAATHLLHSETAP